MQDTAADAPPPAVFDPSSEAPPVGQGAGSRPTPPVHLLSAVVVVAGAGSLATEICASRLLAPFFGNSTVVWANVIGLILIYLSVGYWIGGRVADRYASPVVLGRILCAAAVCIAVLPFIAHPVLSFGLRGFQAVSAGVVVGSFFSTLLLFSAPVTLLGMVSPMALRLALIDVAHAGRTAGRLSSLGTLGAIAGTFLPALVTIPAIGTQRTMLGAALLVGSCGATLLPRRWAAIPILVALLIAIPPGAVKGSVGLVEEHETAYGYVRVLDMPDGRRVMQVDDGIADQSVYRANTVLTGGEWDMPLIVPPLLGHPLRSVLIIGNAGGTTARALAGEYPDAHIDAVEIDPTLTDIARRDFGLDALPQVHTITGDGRAVLATSDSRYDLVVVDAYHQAYIPFHLVTQEFFRLVRDHLTPGGAVALNVARVPNDESLPMAVDGTLATVFPTVLRWPALRFNELAIGLDVPMSRDEAARRVGAAPHDVQPLVPLVRRDLSAVAPSTDPLTDDRAPVEWLTDRAVLEYVLGGGVFSDTLLPTFPG